jgi:ADP-heptose:LPS heptosyltransferase
MAPKLIHRILVIKTRALGDTLLATPALRALKQALPDARLTAVVSPEGREVLEANPDVDELLTYSKTHPKWGYHLHFMAELRQREFDLAVALHASFRTALLARLSGARVRVVHNHSGRNFFSNRRILAKKESKSTIQRDLDAIRALGFPEAGEQLTFPVAEAHRVSARAFLKGHGLEGSKRLFLLAPGAGKERKRWTAAAAAAFLNQIIRRLDSDWILLTGPAEQELGEMIRRQVKNPLPIFSRSLKEAGALMSLSQGMITADSGPKHVAVAVGLPTLTLWTDEPEAEWHPYALDQHGLVRSPTGVVADIKAEDVVAAAEKHFKPLLKK